MTKRKYDDHILMQRLGQIAAGDLSRALLVQTEHELRAHLEITDRQIADLEAKLGAQEKIHKELAQVCSALKIENETLLARIKDLRGEA